MDATAPVPMDAGGTFGDANVSALSEALSVICKAAPAIRCATVEAAGAVQGLEVSLGATLRCVVAFPATKSQAVLAAANVGRVMGSRFRMEHVAIFAWNEHVAPFGQSQHGVFVNLSAHATCAAHYFSRVCSSDGVERSLNSISPFSSMPPLPTLRALCEFLLWLSSFASLFTAPCCGCGQLLFHHGERFGLLPPTLRTYAHRLPFHPHCFATESTASDW